MATTAPIAAPLAAPTRPRAARSGRRPLESALALGLLGLAMAAVVAAVLLSGGGDGDGGQRAQERPQAEAPAGRSDGRERAEGPGAEAPAEETPAEETPAEDAPAEDAPAEEAAPAPDPVRGAALNAEGFALMGSGDYAAAVPVLQEAVAYWPEDSRDLEYAYALYNLGKSLNQAGRPAEAIPYLEKRLTWANQRGVVKQELRLARRNAGQG